MNDNEQDTLDEKRGREWMRAYRVMGFVVADTYRGIGAQLRHIKELVRHCERLRLERDELRARVKEAIREV